MNKKIISALAFACFTMFQVNSFAQDTNEAKTLFGSGNPISTKHLGFFVAPSYGITQLDGSTASLFNLRGGVNYKDKFSFGAYFNTSLNQIRPQSETIQNIYMDFWTVGGFAEYTLFSKKVAHLTFPLYVGYGEVQMDDEDGDVELGEANFFQIEPSALLEVNLHKYVRFNIGAGYRFVSQMNYRNFDQSDISGLTGYVGLKFGLFR
jgi:hypothetical protein